MIISQRDKSYLQNGIRLVAKTYTVTLQNRHFISLHGDIRKAERNAEGDTGENIHPNILYPSSSATFQTVHHRKLEERCSVNTE